MDKQQRIRSEQDASEATVAAVVERVRVQREAAEAAEQAQQEALTLTHRNAEFRRNIAESWTRKSEV